MSSPPSCRGGALQSRPHLREDPAEADQTPERRSGTQVQREEQTVAASLPVPAQQTGGPLPPRAAGPFHSAVKHVAVVSPTVSDRPAFCVSPSGSSGGGVRKGGAEV